jgi:hypothetical protein
MQDTPQNPPVKFDLAFTPKIDEYIASTDKPTVKGFATLIGTDLYSVWAWARKTKRDEKGNVTDEFARPQFKAALEKLEAIEKSSKEDKLNPKQELFCKLYSSDKEFFGNGVQSYIEAYEINILKQGAYNGARSSAYDLLTNPHILKRIDELLEVKGLNDSQVDKELLFVIQQKADLGSKVAAIREYNKLKQRITEKIDHTTKGDRMPTPILGGVVSVQGNNGNQ